MKRDLFKTLYIVSCTQSNIAENTSNCRIRQRDLYDLEQAYIA